MLKRFEFIMQREEDERRRREENLGVVQENNTLQNFEEDHMAHNLDLYERGVGTDQLFNEGNRFQNLCFSFAQM